MCWLYIITGILVITAIYLIYTNPDLYKNSVNYSKDQIEGFRPRRWWWGPDWRWGWRRPWYNSRGNWRPYGYYPAYSGYWQQCPNGLWCPQSIGGCNSPICK